MIGTLLQLVAYLLTSHPTYKLCILILLLHVVLLTKCVAVNPYVCIAAPADTCEFISLLLNEIRHSP